MLQKKLHLIYSIKAGVLDNKSFKLGDATISMEWGRFAF